MFKYECIYKYIYIHFENLKMYIERERQGYADRRAYISREKQGHADRPYAKTSFFSTKTLGPAGRLGQTWAVPPPLALKKLPGPHTAKLFGERSM